MKTWILSLSLLASVTVFGEGRPADHGDAPITVTPPISDRAAAPKSDAKLYQMISACLADRPGNGNKAQDDLIKRMLQK